MKNQLNVLGIMSGTSLDGVDFVKISITKNGMKSKYLGMQSFSYPAAIKGRLLAAAKNEIKVHELSELNHELGRFYASCFKKLKSSLKSVDLIGLHGQTVHHRGKFATLQIGEPSYLSMESKKPVASNFRSADIAAGGHGAPLAPLFHTLVLSPKNKVTAVNNLGGISNISLIQNKKLKLAFDTGPASILLDETIRRATRGKKQFDRNGALATKGMASLDLVAQFLKHKFLKEKPPKSCGREEFGNEFLAKYGDKLNKLSLQDQLATLTEFTVQSTVNSYLNFCKPLPQEIIFCGGGTQNQFLMKSLKLSLEAAIKHVQVLTVEDLGWPSQSIEGAAFAILAAHTYWQVPCEIKSSTGAKQNVVLGQITQVR